MASPLRALALLPFALAVTACNTKLSPEDPAVAISTGIPMGAPKATGVRFDAASGRATPADNSEPKHLPLPLPEGLPPDPFDPSEVPEPPGLGDGHAPPAVPKPPKKGMQL